MGKNEKIVQHLAHFFCKHEESEININRNAKYSNFKSDQKYIIINAAKKILYDEENITLNK